MRQHRKQLRDFPTLLARTAVGLVLLVLALGGCGDDPQRPAIKPTPDPRDLDGDGFAPPEDCLEEGWAWIVDEENCGESERFVFAPADGRGAKDFSAVQDGEALHIFHIENPGPLAAGVHERSLGHASTVDLRNWETYPSVLPVHTGDHWMRDAVWAPHVIEQGGRWYMFVTGVQVLGPVSNNRQRIGLFVSDDLFTWEPVDRRCDGVGGDGCILDCAAAFTEWGSELPWSSDCRDAFVLPTDEGWVMYVTLRLDSETQALGIARSENLLDWELVDWIRESSGPVAESPSVVVHDRSARLFWTTASRIEHLRSRDPYATQWTGRTVLQTVDGFASELLPAGRDSWFFFYVSGRNDDLRINLERAVFADGWLDLTRNVGPECRIPAAEIHPMDFDPVDGIDNNCDGRVDYVVPPVVDGPPPWKDSRGIDVAVPEMPRARF